MSRNILSKTLKLTVTPADLLHAVCGSPTKCAIANALRRHNDNEVAELGRPVYTFVKVNPNKVTITAGNILHHYGLSDAALKIVMENDNGELALTTRKPITLKLIDYKPAHTELSDDRKQQIKDHTKAQRAAGKYLGSKTLRRDIARNVGTAGKKLEKLMARAAVAA